MDPPRAFLPQVGEDGGSKRCAAAPQQFETQFTMNPMLSIQNERVPSDAVDHPPAGFAERMVLGLLGRLTRGGLRLEHADGRVRHFGQPGAPVTLDNQW